jgi:ubiquinone/menaquinone biosynthesis C-methylase UbiE/DNA-binding transcriptional ArsR family regulator
MLAVSNTSADLEIDELAALNKAAADVMRLQILQLLQQDSFGVLEIAGIFEVSQSRMSHHLKILASAGLLTTRKEGNSIFYRRAVMGTNTMDLVRGSIIKAVDHLEHNPQIQIAVTRIYQERAMQSQSFFEKHAGKFTDVQDLIAGYQHYADSVKEVMQDLVLPRQASAMEVGPGQGGFLKPLTKIFDHVIALDNSPAMLEIAKQHCDKALHNKIKFVLGDTEVALKQSIKVDFLAFNMVVHHIPSPSEVIKSASKLLNENGYLLITDLCPHNQSWVKESCGDLWLGLDPDDLNQWAKDSGLTRQHQVFMGLRNGFQIQIQLYKKDNI